MTTINTSHEISYLYGDERKTTTAGELTPLKAVRAKCIDCSGGSIHEVKLCVIPECPLYPFRLGKNPYRKRRKLTDQQRREIAERLRKSRAR